MRLCGFIEQCCKSGSEEIRGWAFSSELYLQLFDLYLEWNEADAERSLRLILDLLVDLMGRVEERQGSDSTKLTVLDSLVSIVARQSTKPLAKSAIMVLDRFLSKSVVSLSEIGTRYKGLRGLEPAVSDLQLWKTYLSELFNWMRIQFVCPVAGKFVTTVYRQLRAESDKGFLSDSGNKFTVDLWYEWLLGFLMSEPLLLDGIKNYIFVPLFKSEKGESLAFLEMMNRLDKDVISPQIDLDVPATLRLASLEVGKRVGLVEEPGTHPLLSGVTNSSGLIDLSIHAGRPKEEQPDWAGRPPGRAPGARPSPPFLQRPDPRPLPDRVVLFDNAPLFPNCLGPAQALPCHVL